MDLATQKVAITSQNHGFAVEEASLKDRDVEVTHINLYDRTIEGIRSAPALAFSIQYHPEASPGPHDARYLFAEFIQAIREGK
jgi:carbamoyl-phosphate synthase small subunit